MGRFSKLQDSIFSVFGSAAWKAKNIATFPSSYINVDNIEYIRVSIVPSGNPLNRQSVAGVMLVDIFSSAGKGPKAFNRLADQLDEFLLDKSVMVLNDCVQFGKGYLGEILPDSNRSFSRVRYSIPFNYFGVP
jgi:hypothetical protein